MTMLLKWELVCRGAGLTEAANALITKLVGR
jgi:hypothetical protein